MKIGKYIIEIIPSNAKNFELNIPTFNHIIYDSESEQPKTFKQKKDNIFYLIKRTFKKCKHIKPNTGIRYSIVGKYWIFLIIKQLN